MTVLLMKQRDSLDRDNLFDKLKHDYIIISWKDILIFKQ